MTEKDLEIQNLRRENEWLKKRIELAERTLAETEKKLPKWIKTADKLPEPFVSVLGHMTDAGVFPAVRECYTLGGANFFFPAIDDVHPVDMWAEIPEPDEGLRMAEQLAEAVERNSEVQNAAD